MFVGDWMLILQGDPPQGRKKSKALTDSNMSKFGLKDALKSSDIRIYKKHY